MAELVNLRTARKRARRQQDERNAEANRLAHSQPGHLRKLDSARRAKAVQDLDGHRIEKGDER
jgi:site-specific recombinase XerC